MSNETPVEAEIDLDTFSADFFGQKQTDPEAATSDEGKEAEVEDALNDDTHTGENDTPDTEDELPEAEETPKPKKSRFQERIDELTGKQREAERRALELEQKLNDAIGKLNQQKTEPEPAPATATKEPRPDDLNEDGTEKYPLGEFDVNYFRDVTKYTLKVEREALFAEETRKAEEAKVQNEAKARIDDWNEKLVPARERYPDFQEKTTVLVESLGDLDPTYGEYLSTQIMEMDHGTEVLYYLATHMDEARSIVDSGARKATLALGALEERLRPRSEGEKPVFKATDAPPPPPANKGAAAAHVGVSPDTDDLDAFAKEFFKKRK